MECESNAIGSFLNRLIGQTGATPCVDECSPSYWSWGLLPQLTPHPLRRVVGTAIGDVVVSRLATTVTPIIDLPTPTVGTIGPPSPIVASMLQECGAGVAGVCGVGAGAGGAGDRLLKPASTQCRLRVVQTNFRCQVSRLCHQSNT